MFAYSSKDPTKGLRRFFYSLEDAELICQMVMHDDMEAACPKCDGNLMLGPVIARDGYQRDPELGIFSVFLTDPLGVTIELTEGLRAF